MEVHPFRYTDMLWVVQTLLLLQEWAVLQRVFQRAGLDIQGSTLILFLRANDMSGQVCESL